MPFSPTFIFPETMETVAYNSYYLRQELENLFFKRERVTQLVSTGHLVSVCIIHLHISATRAGKDDLKKKIKRTM